MPPPPPLHRPGERQPPPELQQALGELESAVRKLAGTAQREISDRAADVLGDTAGRLRRSQRRELRRAERFRRRHGGYAAYGRASDDDGGQNAEPAAQGEGPYFGRRRRRRMYRVPHEGVIAGVCAGLARRMGLETWVVRCFAVSGLVFMPQIVFPGYWVMCLLMRRATPEEADLAYGVSRGSSARLPIAGFDRGASVRDRLREARNTFESVEQRLRRMEGYVTSSRYELDREMNKIDC